MLVRSFTLHKFRFFFTICIASFYENSVSSSLFVLLPSVFWFFRVLYSTLLVFLFMCLFPSCFLDSYIFSSKLPLNSIDLFDSLFSILKVYLFKHKFWHVFVISELNYFFINLNQIITKMFLSTCNIFYFCLQLFQC